MLRASVHMYSTAFSTPPPTNSTRTRCTRSDPVQKSLIPSFLPAAATENCSTRKARSIRLFTKGRIHSTSTSSKLHQYDRWVTSTLWCSPATVERNMDLATPTPRCDMHTVIRRWDHGVLVVCSLILEVSFQTKMVQS